jgi:hypothetical protein
VEDKTDFGDTFTGEDFEPLSSTLLAKFSLQNPIPKSKLANLHIKSLTMTMQSKNFLLDTTKNYQIQH